MRSKMVRKSGFKVGRQAEMTATEHSTEVQIAGATKEAEGSLTLRLLMFARRTMEVMQTLRRKKC